MPCRQNERQPFFIAQYPVRANERRRKAVQSGPIGTVATRTGGEVMLPAQGK